MIVKEVSLTNLGGDGMHNSNQVLFCFSTLFFSSRAVQQMNGRVLFNDCKTIGRHYYCLRSSYDTVSTCKFPFRDKEYLHLFFFGCTHITTNK